jgi:hypothetical protein
MIEPSKIDPTENIMGNVSHKLILATIRMLLMEWDNSRHFIYNFESSLTKGK